MDYLKNHCWCSSSHWDNDHYDCQIIVNLSSYKEGCKEDWDNLTHKVEVFSQEIYDDQVAIMKSLHDKYPESYKTDIMMQPKSGYVKITKFKPEVMTWLDANIPDFNGEKGWCVGSDAYTLGDSNSSYCVFMQRRKDAMLFIKTWSKWKKPINYCQYFTDVRKKLDLTTLKYISR
jgi:hypothetical protein